MGDETTGRDGLRDWLKRAVLTLEMPPGCDLDEAGLSTRFGVSRTPLREVFRELAGLGYLDLRPNRGARVAELSQENLRDFFLAAPMIYGAVLTLAARAGGAGLMDALDAAQSRFRHALAGDDPAARTLANTAFHEITGRMAGNIYLLPSFHRLLIDHARIGTKFYGAGGGLDAQARRDEASAQHDAIIAAIASHDEAEAARLAEAHWQLSRGQIEAYVMPRGLTHGLGKEARTA